MKKNTIAIIMAAAALALSIYSSFMNVKPISVDGANMIGWTVGVLTILVTILIGWQIYKTIEIDRLIDRKINEAREVLTKEIEGKLKFNKGERSAFSSLINGGILRVIVAIVNPLSLIIIWGILSAVFKKKSI